MHWPFAWPRYRRYKRGEGFVRHWGELSRHWLDWEKGLWQHMGSCSVRVCRISNGNENMFAGWSAGYANKRVIDRKTSENIVIRLWRPRARECKQTTNPSTGHTDNWINRPLKETLSEEASQVSFDRNGIKTNTTQRPESPTINTEAWITYDKHRNLNHLR